MKKRTTKKYIINNFKNVLSVGYCEAQYLLNGKTPDYYTAGVYGWNADVYIIDFNTVIVTGYRPFGVSIDYDLVEKYNNLAQNNYENDELIEKMLNEIEGEK